jgi:hypothetical protein
MVTGFSHVGHAMPMLPVPWRYCGIRGGLGGNWGEMGRNWGELGGEIDGGGGFMRIELGINRRITRRIPRRIPRRINRLVVTWSLFSRHVAQKKCPHAVMQGSTTRLMQMSHLS